MATHIFKKAAAMFGKLSRMIFGVPADDLAGQNAVTRQREAAPQYLPESKLTEQAIHGVAEDGSVWIPWRVSGNEQWFRRVSGDSPLAEIHGEIPRYELPADDDDDDDEIVETTDDTEAILSTFRRDFAILKSRIARNEIVVADESDFGDIGDFSDDE